MSNGSPLPTSALPPIPAKRYFTIGEVSDLCGVKPHVLRYWEQEFTHLRPMKRRGNRRYYQHHEVLLVRRIRELLYEQGFTISGARNRLGESLSVARSRDTSPGSNQDVAPEVSLQEQLVLARAELVQALALLDGDEQEQIEAEATSEHP
jgi:DNA-binding transcriptional MerR regulator